MAVDRGNENERVLVVEDEEVVSLFIREVLSDRGFAVDIRSEARLALYLCRTRSYVAAVFDVGLPDFNGDELARQCRKVCPRLPIVLATGLPPHDLRAAFAHDALVSVLEKPFDGPALIRRLESLGVRMSST